MKYIQQLEELYNQQGEGKATKLDWIGEYIFDFITYDQDINKKWSECMIDVLTAIVEKKTFEYQRKSQEHYEAFLVMVNMPFLMGKLEWGTSVRGAWIDTHNMGYYNFVNDQIEVEPKEFETFIIELLEWAKK